MNVMLQENGVGTAIEAIYRDLDYARSLIKGSTTHDDDAEHATIRERFSRPSSRQRRSVDSSASSPRGAASDWSVISDQDDYQSSHP